MPISSFMGLQTSLRGLLAQQRALDTTGHNIANASTEGYSRQEAVLSATPALSLPAGAIQGGAGAQLGTGVEVQAYRRVRDSFLDLQFRGQAMRLGDSAQRATSLEQAELALAEPGDDGLSALLSRFWNGWGDLANAPESPAARQALVDRAKTLAGGIRDLDAQLQAVATQAGGEAATLVAAGGEVDGMAREVGSLNEAIRAATVRGEAPNDLMDRRDLLLDKLSDLGQVSTQDLGDGSVRVMFGDAAAPLVDGATVTWPQTVSAPGGRIGALLDIASPTGPVAGYRTELAAFAAGLAASVNALHGTPFFTATAGDEAATLGVAVNASGVRAGAGTAAGANEIALAISGLRGGATDSAYAALVGRIGEDVRSATRQEGNARVLADAVADRRDSVAGVSLDEEMSNLIRFQRGYQASARTMSTVDEMLDVLINRTGRVGL
jgi:flagellar hook-associated protein 1